MRRRCSFPRTRCGGPWDFSWSGCACAHGDRRGRWHISSAWVRRRCGTSRRGRCLAFYSSRVPHRHTFGLTFLKIVLPKRQRFWLGCGPSNHRCVMQAKPSSVPSRRLGRKLRASQRLNVRRYHEGIAWVLAQIVTRRYKLPVAALAAAAGVGEQTLREYLQIKHPDACTTGDRTALALGYFPDKVARLTRRWMRKYRHRCWRPRSAERDGERLYPWEQDSGQS